MHFQPRVRAQLAVTLPSTVAELGVTRSVANGADYRRASHGLYIPASTPDTLEQHIANVIGRLPPGAGVTGWAALRLLRAAYFDGRPVDDWGRPANGPLQAVQVLVPSDGHRRSNPKLRITRTLHPQSTRTFGGIAVVHPCRALLDHVSSLTSVNARVVAVDMAIAAETLTLTSWVAYLEQLPPRTSGAARARSTVRWCREGSRSPLESVLRLIWLRLAKLPEPLLNREIFNDRGLMLGCPDLLEERAGLVVEYDGRAHRDGERHRIDSRRMAHFRDVGLEYEAFVGADIYDERAVATRLRRAHARAMANVAPPRWALRSVEAA